MAAAFDSVINTINFYVDGKNIGTGISDTFNFNSLPSTQGHFYLGSWAGPAHFFNGKLDNIKVFNYARTPAQIAYDYNRGAPIVHWKFNECQGNTVYDSINSLTGTISIGSSGTQNSLGTCSVGTSAAWTAGASGKYSASLSFDGTDDVISIGTTYPRNNFSISVWLKRTGNIDATYSWGGVVGLRQSTEMQRGIRVMNNTIQYKDYHGTPGSLDSGVITNLNQWYHAVVTNDGDMLKIYIDGIEKNSYSTPSVSTDSVTETQIGAINWGTPPNRSFNGQIDDVKIFNYALTNEQIKTLYNENSSVRYGN